jgi:hypothetical protein
MQRVVIDTEPSSIRDFIGKLAIGADGVELELHGRVVCRVFPAGAEDVDPEALVRQRWDLIRKAQQRTKDLSAREVENEIRIAIEEVRARARG